jgi:hypothetical protein
MVTRDNVRMFLICLLGAMLAMSCACHAAPASYAGIAAIGTAAADAGIGAAMQNGDVSQSFGLSLISLLHNIFGAVAGVGDLKAQVAAQHDQILTMTTQLANVPGTGTLIGTGAGGAVGGAILKIAHDALTADPAPAAKA